MWVSVTESLVKTMAADALATAVARASADMMLTWLDTKHGQLSLPQDDDWYIKSNTIYFPIWYSI